MELAERCRVAVATAGVFLGVQRLVSVGGYALLWDHGGELLPRLPSGGPALMSDLLPVLGVGVAAALVVSSVAALMRRAWAGPAMLVTAVACIAFVLTAAGDLISWWIRPTSGFSGSGLWIGVNLVIEQVCFELAYYGLMIVVFWQDRGQENVSG